MVHKFVALKLKRFKYSAVLLQAEVIKCVWTFSWTFLFVLNETTCIH